MTRNLGATGNRNDHIIATAAEARAEIAKSLDEKRIAEYRNVRDVHVDEVVLVVWYRIGDQGVGEGIPCALIHVSAEALREMIETRYEQKEMFGIVPNRRIEP